MAETTPDIIVARSLGTLLNGLIRQHAYWGRWLGLNLLVGVAIFALSTATAWFVSLWHTLAVVAYLSAFAGVVGVAVLYYLYGRKPLHASYLAFAVVQARVHQKGSVPDGAIPYSYGVAASRQLFGDGRLYEDLRTAIRASLRASHRHLIDVLAWIDWLRRVKLSAPVTELTHGTAKFLCFGIEGAVLGDDRPDLANKAVRAITRYLADWKPLLKSAIRCWLAWWALWLLAVALLLLPGHYLVRAFTFWPSQLLVFAGLLLLARFLVQGCYAPLAQALMIDRAQLRHPSEDETQIWEQRLSKVSREFQELLQQRGSERAAAEEPLAETAAKQAGRTGDDGCFEVET